MVNSVFCMLNKIQYAVLAATVLLTATVVSAANRSSAGLYAANQGSESISAGNQGSDDILERISKGSLSMKTMRCDFRQVRILPLMDEPQESTGKMLYREPSAIKWEYKEPFQYSLVIDGDLISIDTQEGTTELSGEAGRMFRGMAGIMLGSMSGDYLKESRTFQVAVTEEEGEWIVLLIPQRRDLKRIYSMITMVFDPDTSLLKRLTMTEQGGGSTEITISNVSINGDYEAEW